MATKPLYGDPTASAPIFNKYAVLLGSLTATTPTAPAAFTLNDPGAGTPVTDEWDPVGALVEDNPFGNGEESIDVTSHTAAGFGVYAKTFKNQEETIEFTALETTLVTLGILYDASDLTDAGGVISGTLKQRDPSETFKIAFQRENANSMERRVCTNYAQINTITRNQNNDRAEYTVSVTIYPTSDRELYDYYLGPLA
jgi:hypothetical protein